MIQRLVSYIEGQLGSPMFCISLGVGIAIVLALLVVYAATRS